MIGGLSAISSEEQSSSGSLHSKQRGESWLLGATLTSKWGSLHVDIKPMSWAPAGVGSYHRRIDEFESDGDTPGLGRSPLFENSELSWPLAYDMKP